MSHIAPLHVWSTVKCGGILSHWMARLRSCWNTRGFWQLAGHCHLTFESHVHVSHSLPNANTTSTEAKSGLNQNLNCGAQGAPIQILNMYSEWGEDVRTVLLEYYLKCQVRTSNRLFSKCRQNFWGAVDRIWSRLHLAFLALQHSQHIYKIYVLSLSSLAFHTMYRSESNCQLSPITGCFKLQQWKQDFRPFCTVSYTHLTLPTIYSV